ncbi:MAG: histidinol-phosphate aminotransferase family protein [Planctomyces sp.]|nr:histidinol-phosphate aminotransferase family protein [Planctomyces sp.]
MHGNLLNPPTSVSSQKSRFRAADREQQVDPAQPVQRCDQIQPAYEVRIASEADRREIARLRYDVYSTEIGQHPQNSQRELSDSLDGFNIMLVVLYRGTISGFVSLTPPSAPKLSIDKYFRRDELPFEVHSRLYEVRLLTVVQSLRGNETAALLLYSALRWVESHQGTQIVAIGRKEVLPTYLRIGMQQQGLRTQSGAVTYELLLGDVHRLRSTLAEFTGFLQRLSRITHWALPFGFDTPVTCFHGGAFFEAIGERFDGLQKASTVINADVLDAWYPPAPAVLETLQQYLPWLVRTSPPTRCGGFIETVASARGVLPGNILPGAGSSDLIFRVLPHWLTKSSRVLILDPMYGEYAYVLESVIGCCVERLALDASQNFRVSADELIRVGRKGFDLIILVNPNSPTGQHLSRAELETVFQQLPPSTKVWVDETYIEFAEPGQSLESFAAKSESVVVCKSMSKVYALSGLRAAYLCGGTHLLESLHPRTPPWVIGLPAQVAAVRALENQEYYRQRIAETHLLRDALSAELQQLGWTPVPGIANFLLCRLPETGGNTAQMIRDAREHGLFLRNPAPSGAPDGSRWIRIAVKDHETNRRMIEILRKL